jgi:hypothetical protein
MFLEAFNQTLRCNPNMMNALGDGIYGCRWITNLVSTNHVTPYQVIQYHIIFCYFLTVCPHITGDLIRN